MITVKQQQNKFLPEIGDFIFDTENLIHSYLSNEGFGIFPLLFLGNFDPFVSLRRMEIYDNDLFQKSCYNCPFLNSNKFYGIVPVAIQTNDSSVYRVGPFARSNYDYVFDLDWQKHCLLDNDDSVVLAFLGSGYTEGTFPSDGSNKIINVRIELSNGDFIVAKTFEWYNK